MEHYSSSSCGQEPLTPQQTEGNEKRVQQPMALYFICRETWLILQLCGHCLWMQTIWLQNVGQARKEACGVKLRLRKLSTNFLCRGFRSCDVFKGSNLHDCKLIVKCQNVKGQMWFITTWLVQLWSSFLSIILHTLCSLKLLLKSIHLWHSAKFSGTWN